MRPDGPVLHWPGKPADPLSSSRGRDATPLPVVEIAGEGHANQLFFGDNRDVMRSLLAGPRRPIDLVYVDPPFGTGASFSLTERAAGEEGAHAYHDDDELGAYLTAMREQLALMRALLADTGSIVVHCDWHVSHYLRCLLDEVFGRGAFKNEIVWRYRRWPAKTRVFQRMHDTLFWYGKHARDDHAWTPAFESLAPSTLKTWGTNRQVADFSSGRRKPSQTDEPSPGAPMADVWEIGIIAPIAHERVGYPTQKPEALLRRILETMTKPGALVADWFAGSGTTLAVAEQLGRRWIGCDVGAAAIHACRKRLLRLPNASFELRALEAPIDRGDAGPDVRARATVSGPSVVVSLEGEGARDVDLWSVDWDHDGAVFRHRSSASKRTARDALELTASHVYADGSPARLRRIAVRVADPAGNARTIVVSPQS